MGQRLLCIVGMMSFILWLMGCNDKNKDAATTQKEITEEVIVMGKIKNREYYPQVKELTLQLPYYNSYKKSGRSYISPIAEDNTFYFNIQLHSNMCEVSIKPYVEHLYVQPGDSIYLEFDFKNLLDLTVTGDGMELNELLTRYTEGGGYRPDYPLWGYFHSNDELESLLNKEYQERWEGYQEFIGQHHPNEEVQHYIEEMLLADYYNALFKSATMAMNYRLEGVDAKRYTNKIAEASKLFERNAITTSHFHLAENVYNFLMFTNERVMRNDSTITLEEILAPTAGTAIHSYLYACNLSKSLQELKDNRYFDNQKENFDRFVNHPYLRASLLQLYQSNQSYMKNPKHLSDFILYGQYPDEIKAGQNMTYMQPIYDILKKHRGKMIYIEHWGTFCPPCLAEMEPLKELRKKYLPEDIVFVSLGGGGSKEQYEAVLDKYNIRMPGIEHIYIPEWVDEEAFRKISKQLNLHSIPYYFILNREGVIVNYGSMMRPSYPSTTECIEKWLK